MLSATLFAPLAHIGFDPSGTLIWIGVGLLGVGSACAVLLGLILQRSRALEHRLRQLEALEPIRLALAELTKAREDLDLRRIEHALLDVRAGQKRTEDALLRAVELPAAAPAGSFGAPLRSLPERLTNRLLALGYERVQIANSAEELARMAERGEVLFEARRDGAVWKGHAVIEQGSLTHLDMKPVYSMFP